MHDSQPTARLTLLSGRTPYSVLNPSRMICSMRAGPTSRS